jgi:outer membrane receptor protein involved in Fe transport
MAQTGTIRGTVVDDKGLPVPFANVSVEQAGAIVTGGSTDFDGVFKIKALKPASNYYVKASAVGFSPAGRNGVVVSSDEIVMVDFTLTTGVKLDEVVVTEHRVPLVKQDGGASQVFTSDNVTAMATRGVAGVATMVGGVQEDGNGGIGSIRGSRQSGTNNDASFIYVDGVKVRGSNAVTQAATAEVKVFTGGIPAKYGDASGGIISITTKGAAEKTHGGFEIRTSGFSLGGTNIGFDQYNNNLLSANLTGPLIRIKDKSDPEGKKKRSIVGYFLAAELNYSKDRDPSANGVWKVKDDALEELWANPVRRNPVGGTDLSAEYISSSQLELVKAKQNTPIKGIVANANLDFVTTPNVTLKVGGSLAYNVRNEFSFDRSLFNFDNNGQQIQNTWRVFGRYTQRFNKKDIDPDNPPAIMNALYNIQVDYESFTRTRQDESHKQDLFNYGYVGKFVTHREPTYALGVDTTQRLFGWLQGPYNDTLVDFTPSDINPNMSAYTQQYYNLYPDAEDHYENLTQIDADRGALRNGDAPSNVYGLWNGSGLPFNLYSNDNRTQLRISASGSADIKNHSISLGFEYEQRVDSRIDFTNPMGLWTIGRQRINSHLANLDLENGIVHLDEHGSFSDTISYNPLFTPDETNEISHGFQQSYFDYNMREALGLDPQGMDFLYIDSLDPEFLNIDWFSADELLNSGNPLVTYYGYDHTGKKLSSNPTFDDFFSDRDAYGNLTRKVGAFRPIYMAGYLEDEFTFKDLIFRVGFRVDRFDANQKVLKDPYLLKEAKTAAEISAENPDIIHPENIGDDFVVYANSIENPTAPVGYRDGDTWYNIKGEEISEPSSLEVGGNIAPWLKNTPDPSSSDVVESGAFKDYVPQVNVMPRVSFSFPISKDANFYANYDVLTERPTGRNRLDLVSYLFIQNDNDRLNNPNLKPTKTIEYSVGFKQKLTKNSAIHLNAFYREVRDQIQVIRLAGAYPTSYTTFGNIDFGTVKGLTISYDMRRTKRFQMRMAYTLQFADGTGSNDETGLNLVNAGFPNLRIISPYDYDQRHRIVLNADYRFNAGSKYKGPKTITKGGKTINWLQSFGANLTVSANSGSPYTRQTNANARALIVPSGSSFVEGGINGSSRPWQYRLDLKVERDFNLGGKEKEKNGVKVKGFKSYLNVYLQVLNLLNTANVVSVYRKTGSADDDGYLAAASNQTGIAAQTDEQSYRDQYSIKAANPDNFSTPRQIRLGVAWNF